MEGESLLCKKTFGKITDCAVFTPDMNFPDLRMLVLLLLEIVPMLRDVFLMCSFLFLAFALVGLQLWQGVLRQGCYNAEDQLFLDPILEAYVCSLDTSGEGGSLALFRSKQTRM
jgi:hypothetical protein